MTLERCEETEVLGSGVQVAPKTLNASWSCSGREKQHDLRVQLDLYYYVDDDDDDATVAPGRDNGDDGDEEAR